MMIFICLKYSGWYSVSDEAFYNEDEIVEVDGKKINFFKIRLKWVDEESVLIIKVATTIT